MTYAEILSHIYALGRFGIKPGLERISRLMAALGDPQKNLPTVHVVGTNGKGSTASFLSSILTTAGYRTGLFTSPHLISFTERIRIDGREISEDSVVRLAQRVMAAAPPETTFFEMITALAVLYFAEEGVDIAVFEAGMGGSRDATNVLDGLLTVITPVALDHVEYLGEGVPEIAAEKASICKPGTSLVSARQITVAEEAIAAKAAEIGATLYRCGTDFDACWKAGKLEYRGMGMDLHEVVPGLHGRYQSGNAATALAAAEVLSAIGFPIERAALVGGVENASWPGRMEMFDGEPRILLDGAHNPAGAEALADALADVPRGKLVMVIGVMADKEREPLLKALLPLADLVVTVSPALERALPAAELAESCRRQGAAVEVGGSVAEGVERARELAGLDGLVVVCGSLFTVGEARGHLLSRPFEAFRG
ncbi:bifunctional folylpolyglutamate synthase/dihydrofolate synthase [Geomonas sp. Red276]